MRPLCGKKHGGKSECASACATMRVSRTISIYRAQRSQQGCSLSLGMLRLAEPPTGRARLRSSLNLGTPITPIKTSRVATLHLGCINGSRGARRVIGATAKPPICNRRQGRGLTSEAFRPPSSREGDRRSGGRSPQAVEGVHRVLPKIRRLCFIYFICSKHMMFSSKTVRCPSENIEIVGIGIDFCLSGLVRLPQNPLVHKDRHHF